MTSATRFSALAGPALNPPIVQAAANKRINRMHPPQDARKTTVNAILPDPAAAAKPVPSNRMGGPAGLTPNEQAFTAVPPLCRYVCGQSGRQQLRGGCSE